jgi:hypothetical protein
MKTSKSVFTIVGSVIAIMMPLKMVSADPGTLPPGQLSAFTAEWWQWALSIPKSRNPLFDTTGENCMIGQRDFVWFLAGTLFGGSATRACSVPEDKTLFFPVINVSFFNSPNLCGQGNQSFTVAEERAAIKPIIDAAKNLSVTVDGVDVKNTLLRRVQSQVFDVALPDDNVFLPDFPPCPAGIYSPTVDDGFYVSLGPLTPGQHTIHFHSESPGVITEDITYHLNIVPVTLQ